jgi:hypothetical protein
VIKPILIALVMASTPVVAAPYDDTVTFSASAVCSELTGVKYPSKTNDKDWKSYLQCIQVMHYFNTKY